MENPVRSVRISSEAGINYIDTHFEGSASRYINDSLKRDLELAKRNGRRNQMKHNSSVVLLMLFALMMVIQIMTTTNVFLQLFSGMIAVCIMLYVLFEILGADNARQ